MLPYRTCVVGSGPAGFYFVDALQKAFDSRRARYPSSCLTMRTPKGYRSFDRLQFDILEKLPTPYGLIRYGVAPDHPEIRNVESRFEEIASREHVRWLGNIELGKGVSIEQLLNTYNTVVLATGASEVNKLQCKGSTSAHVHYAKNIVEWYNGYPFSCYNLQEPPWGNTSSPKEAVIIGNGNVSLDVARIFLQDSKKLEATDISSPALRVLQSCDIQRITIVGRRGALESAFSIKEFREMLSLENVDVSLDKFCYESSDVPRSRRRLIDLLKSVSNQSLLDQTKKRLLNLKYNLRPLEIRARSILFECLEPSPGVNANDNSASRLVWSPNGKQVEMNADVVIFATGYRGSYISSVPLEEKTRMISHSKGAVLSIPRLYTVGWAKRGAHGVIASVIPDALETAQTMLEEECSKRLSENGHIQPGSAAEEPKTCDLPCFKNAVTFEQWKRIQNFEKCAGVLLGKSSERILQYKKMIAVACGQ